VSPRTLQLALVNILPHHYKASKPRRPRL